MKLRHAIITAVIVIPISAYIGNSRSNAAQTCIEHDGEPDMGLFVNCKPPVWCPSNSDKCSSN